jgi:hypothetical protein
VYNWINCSVKLLDKGTLISLSNWGETMEWKYTADEIMVKLN